MLLRPLLAPFILGCALGVGATMLIARRSGEARAPDLPPDPPAREIAPAPIMVGEMPDDLSLQEIYERVSFFG